MALFTLFDSAPFGSDVDYAGNYTNGTEFYVTETAWATQIRYAHHTANVGNLTPRTAAIYSTNNGTSGTMVAGPFTMPTPVRGQWCVLDLPEALELIPNQRYRVAILSPGIGGNSSWVSDYNFFTTGAGSTNQVTGPLVRVSKANSINNAQGSWTSGASITFPQYEEGGEATFADVTVSDVDPDAALVPTDGFTVALPNGTEVPAMVEGTALPNGTVAPFEYTLEGLPVTFPPNPSNGTGGLRGDYTNVSRSNGTHTSTYHIYAAHITGTAPLGIIYALHGDGAGWHTNPNSASMESLKAIARARNMILVIPRSPDQVTPITWWETFSWSTWLADLHNWQMAIHNIDRNKVYWFGYSGGAEVLTYSLISAYSSRFTGGGALMMAGGGKNATELYAPMSAALQTPGRFLMHWVVGELDNPADGGDDLGFDAVQASINGEAFYSARNIPTQLTIVPGRTHYDIIPDGIAQLELMLG